MQKYVVTTQRGGVLAQPRPSPERHNGYMLRIDPHTLALAGDWHGATSWAVDCVHALADQGMRTIIQVGDFAYLFEREFLDELEGVLAQREVTLYFLRGNHDDTSVLSALEPRADGTREVRPHVFYLPDGVRFLIGSERALAIGGAGSIDRVRREAGVSWWEDERLEPSVADSAIRDGAADVVFTHEAPHGVDLLLNLNTARFFENMDPGVLKWCDEHRALVTRVVDAVQPRLVVHGHHHKWLRNERSGTERHAVVLCLDRDGSAFERNTVHFTDPALQL